MPVKGMLNSLSNKNVTLASLTPEIMFEFEAYLFQFKALLDMFASALGKVYKQNPSNIKKLIKILDDNSKLESYGWTLEKIHRVLHQSRSRHSGRHL